MGKSQDVVFKTRSIPAALAVAAQIRVARIVQAHMQRLILAQLALGLTVGADVFSFASFIICSFVTPHNSNSLFLTNALAIPS